MISLVKMYNNPTNLQNIGLIIARQANKWYMKNNLNKRKTQRGEQLSLDYIELYKNQNRCDTHNLRASYRSRRVISSCLSAHTHTQDQKRQSAPPPL